MTKLLRASLAFVFCFHSMPGFASSVAGTTLAPLTFTIADLRAAYPNAKIRVVNQDEYALIEQGYAQNGAVMDAVEVGERTAQPKAAPRRSRVRCRGDYGSTYSKPSSTSSSEAEYLNPNTGVRFDSFASTGDKDFLILVAVVGVVVVAATLIYSLAYIYQMSAQGFECHSNDEFGYRFSHVYDHSSSQDRKGDLNGVYYTRGYDVPFGLMGLTAEVGHHSLEISVNEADAKAHFNGAYGLVGPSFSFLFGGENSSAFQIELLAGTSTEKQIGLMSTLRFGLDLRVAPEVSLGFNFGAALIDIKGFDSYIKDRDQLNYLSGASVGYRF